MDGTMNDSVVLWLDGWMIGWMDGWMVPQVNYSQKRECIVKLQPSLINNWIN